MLRIVMAGLGLLGIAGDAGDKPVLPDWMAGCWEQKAGDRWTEECWMPPRGGIMLGAGRSGRGDTLGDWEATQIVIDPEGGMTFWAAPGGSERTAFTWAADDAGGVTFHNAGHDYPQRVRYWRDGEALMAEIAMDDGSKAMRWRYTAVK